ncbi:MAG: GIY-YIG nuclease family protein [Ignavibacteriales bacterium]|nr:GIY-YIG nuclease family protein [Ignavibacteriales bacterium]
MKSYFYIYVLRSLKDNQNYVGYTTNIQRRIKEHNNGLVISTRKRRPLTLVYWEGCLNRQDATTREKYLKTAWGKRYIKNRIKNYLTGFTL